jgi:hypothetical protein
VTEEKLITENTNLEVETFYALFNDILLSEIITYQHDHCSHLGEIKGITFFGRKISLKEYQRISELLIIKGLKLLISFDTFTKRWRDFSFPKFPNKEILLDIDKQCFSLIRETNNKTLLNYTYSYDQDRQILNSTFEKWISEYNLDILWNDYFDIVLKFEKAENKKGEISREIDELLYYKISNELSEEEKIKTRFENYPILSLYLK